MSDYIEDSQSLSYQIRLAELARMDFLMTKMIMPIDKGHNVNRQRSQCQSTKVIMDRSNNSMKIEIYYCLVRIKFVYLQKI